MGTNEYKRQWYLENRERLLQKARDNYIVNRDERQVKDRVYRQKNKDKISEYLKAYYSKNKTKLAEYGKKWRDANSNILRKKHRAYMKEKYHTNINYRVLSNIRSRIGLALNGKIKADTTKSLLGCSIEYFRGYLENKFKDGMTWNNYNEWHIDHIIPCAGFDLTDKQQQKICFHYTNLQPLWAIENIKKSDKILTTTGVV